MRPDASSRRAGPCLGRRALLAVLLVAALGLGARLPGVAAGLALLQAAGCPQIGTQPVTIVAWDHHTSPSARARVDEVYAAFMKKYPNITIKRVSKPLDENLKTQRLALSGDDSPDLVMTANGWGGMGTLVKNNLIISLDKYYDQCGWRQQYGAGILRGLSFTPDGKTFGSGNVYGVSEGMAFQGVYYNK